MSKSTKLKVLGLVALLVAAGLTLQGAGQATSGSTVDPTGDTSPGGSALIDVTEARHGDSGTALTWSFHTAATFNPEESLDTVQWDLDLNSNGVYNEPSDACIQLQPLFNGNQTMRAALKASCGITTAGTTDATFDDGNDVTIAFDNAFFRSSTGFNGASYQYKMRTSDFAGESDAVPNTGAITHEGVLPAATPTPTVEPTPTPTVEPTPTPTVEPTPTPPPGQGPCDPPTGLLSGPVFGLLGPNIVSDLLCPLGL